jgi:hypothetical protein
VKVAKRVKATGRLLAAYAQHGEERRGFGVDNNLSAVQLAQLRIEKEGLAGRVRVHHGDFFNLDKLVTDDERASIDASQTLFSALKVRRLVN